jgi:uncharacterized protein YndB with AHSA1/START domain
MNDDHTLVITRVLEAPRELVFAAWVDQAQATQRWGPKGFATVSNEMDVRVGGAWRRCLRSPEGSEHISRGVYREIITPERLVFTFSWEHGGAPGHGPETVVTLTFVDLRNGRTALTLRQEGFATVAGRDDHHRGWSSALDRLTDYLTQQRT